MEKIPAYRYVCECCGREFDSAYACAAHEQAMREKESRRRNCPHCYGTGYVTESSGDNYVGTFFGTSYYTPRQVYKVPCPHCSK